MVYMYALINPSNDLKLFKTQVEPLACIFSKSNIIFYFDIFWYPFLMKFGERLCTLEREKQIVPPSDHFLGLYSYTT